VVLLRDEMGGNFYLRLDYKLTDLPSSYTGIFLIRPTSRHLFFLF
jgi:hypothetical protein